MIITSSSNSSVRRRHVVVVAIAVVVGHVDGRRVRRQERRRREVEVVVAVMVMSVQAPAEPAAAVRRQARRPPGHRQPGLGQLDEVLLHARAHLLARPARQLGGDLGEAARLEALGRVLGEQVLETALFVDRPRLVERRRHRATVTAAARRACVTAGSRLTHGVKTLKKNFYNKTLTSLKRAKKKRFKCDNKRSSSVTVNVKYVILFATLCTSSSIILPRCVAHFF